MNFCHRKMIPVIGKLFLSQDSPVTGRITKIHVKGTSYEIPVTGKFLSKKNSYSMKVFLVSRRNFLSQENIFIGKFPVKGN